MVQDRLLEFVLKFLWAESSVCLLEMASGLPDNPAVLSSGTPPV